MNSNYKQTIFVGLCEYLNLIYLFDWLRGNKPKWQNLYRIKNPADLNQFHKIVMNLENKHPIYNLHLLKYKLRNILKK